MLWGDVLHSIPCILTFRSILSVKQYRILVLTVHVTSVSEYYPSRSVVTTFLSVSVYECLIVTGSPQSRSYTHCVHPTDSLFLELSLLVRTGGRLFPVYSFVFTLKVYSVVW